MLYESTPSNESKDELVINPIEYRIYLKAYRIKFIFIQFKPRLTDKIYPYQGLPQWLISKESACKLEPQEMRVRTLGQEDPWRRA